MSTGTGYTTGKNDAALNRPAAPQGNTHWQVHQNYLDGYRAGTKK